jgi:hypothetical protein
MYDLEWPLGKFWTNVDPGALARVFGRFCHFVIL